MESDSTSKGEKRSADQAEINTNIKITKEETPTKKQKVVPITAPPITDENKEEITKKVLKQVHFYFSDSNMNDKFLRKKIEEDPESFIDLSIITSFNKMKEICVDVEFIAKVLKENSTKLIIEGTRVKRTTPWPTEDTSGSRTVVVKHIPSSWHQEKIEEYFQQIGPVNKVDKTTRSKKKRDGVLIEFESEEMAKKAVETELSVEGKTLGISALVDPQKEARKKKHQEKQQQKEDKANEALKRFESAIEKGRVIKFSNLNPEISFKELTEKFKAVGNNAWIIYNNKDTFGYLKFKTPAETAPYLEKLNQTKPLFDGKELTYEILQGEDEDAFWEKEKQGFLNNKGKGKGKGRGNFKKGKQRWKK